MRTVLALLLMMSPAVAGQCYTHEDQKDWTITLNDPGTQPELVWKQGSETVELDTSGAGTGIPVRVAWDAEGNGYKYRFVGDMLLVDMELYTPGCQ